MLLKLSDEALVLTQFATGSTELFPSSSTDVTWLSTVVSASTILLRILTPPTMPNGRTLRSYALECKRNPLTDADAEGRKSAYSVLALHPAEKCDD